MIEVGKAEAARRRSKNVTWMFARAEDLAAPDEWFELITIGEAFHRLDQRLIAAQSLRWLKPRGCIAMIGCDDILSGRGAWQRIAVSVGERWTHRAFPDGWASSTADTNRGPNDQKRVLEAAGFEDVANYLFVEPHVWTVDSIVGYLYSTSVCSRRLLGDDLGKFEAEIRAALLADNPNGIFSEPMKFGYTLGRKPL
jgi:hypothetical protein